MNKKFFESPVARRLFLARVGAGVGMFGATLGTASAAGTQSTPQTPWAPTRHEQDEWYDQIPGKHRLVFDTTSPESMEAALRFSNTFFEANKSGYGLQDADLAVLVVARHKSTVFGFNDAMWAKYGVELSKDANNFVDPKTKEAAIVNVYATQGGQMNGLLKRGVHIPICQMATRRIAGILARATGGKADEVLAELSANLVTNGHLVAAGIVAVNRAQEHGYALAHVEHF